LCKSDLYLTRPLLFDTIIDSENFTDHQEFQAARIGDIFTAQCGIESE